MEPEIVREPLSKERLAEHAQLYGDMVKIVIDIERVVLALGGEWHSDGEALLLADGSKQENLWGANIYPNEPRENRLVYSSLINIRPRQGNRGMEIQDLEIRKKVQEIVDRLIS